MYVPWWICSMDAWETGAQALRLRDSSESGQYGGNELPCQTSAFSECSCYIMCLWTHTNGKVLSLTGTFIQYVSKVNLSCLNIFWNRANGRVLNTELLYTDFKLQVIFVLSFTELFRKAFSSLIRTDCNLLAFATVQCVHVCVCVFDLFLYTRQVPQGWKVSMLIDTYPHKALRKIKVTICNHQADSQLYVWLDVWSGEL